MNVSVTQPAPSPFARPSISPAVTVVLLGGGVIFLSYNAPALALLLVIGLGAMYTRAKGR